MLEFTTISTGSIGNSYLLSSGTSTLILECGVRFPDILKALDYDLTKVAGCIYSHLHQDHSKSASYVAKAGIDVYASKETLSKFTGHRFHAMEPKKKYTIGEFEVIGFPLVHDVECFGFLIKHEDNTICFCTDTNYIPYNFPGLTNILVEVNYSQDILDDKMFSGKVHESVRNRVNNSHLEFETFKHFLSQTDLTAVHNIVMIHLSDSNSNEKQFIKEVQDLTGKSVYAARAGMKINLSKHPF
jgi:phosphoribosyl 1,2-cyclic phosphodiesterase